MIPAILLCLVGVLPAQTASPSVGSAAQPDLARRERTIEVARKIMIAARYGTLVTIGADGVPQARIVDPTSPDSALVVRLATNPRSRKVAEIRADPRVTLLYFDPARLAYVTVVGRATEITGAAKSAHRKKEWDAFFDKEKPDTYSLYQIVPSRIEVVSAQDGLSGDASTWRPEIVWFN